MQDDVIPGPLTGEDGPAGEAGGPEPAGGSTDAGLGASTTDAEGTSAAVALAPRSRPAALDVPNEAVPAVPPEAGTAPTGSIPAAHARAVWARAQALNWRLFLVRFISAGLAVVLTVAIVPGLGFAGWHWGDFTRIAVIFGVLNATVKPLLQFLVLRFIFSTYGIVVIVINTLLLVLLAAILEDTFVAARPLSFVLGGLVVGVLGLMLETLLGAPPPILDRDYKERNALS
jgi:putative membrane protein